MASLKRGLAEEGRLLRTCPSGGDTERCSEKRRKTRLGARERSPKLRAAPESVTSIIKSIEGPEKKGEEFREGKKLKRFPTWVTTCAFFDAIFVKTQG